LSEKLKHDVASDLDKHQAIIMQALEMEIISAYHYQAGALRAGLQYDRQLKKALEVLSKE